MSRKTAAALILAIALGALLLGTAATVDWDAGETIHGIPFDPAEGEMSPGDLNHALFEEYGAVVIVMGVLMFAAILGGVYLAKEDAP